MKKVVLGVMAALMLSIVASGAVYAAEGVAVSAGAKMWANTLKIENGGFSNTSDMAILIGPAVEAKFSNNIFVNAAIMTTATKYKTDYASGSFEMSRTDIELAVGYSFLPNFGAFAGYRNSDLGGDADSTTSGPMIGVRGSVPITNEFSIYGNLAYLMFEDKPNSFPSEDAPGFGVEVGVQYAFMKNLEGGVGFRMEQTKGADSDTTATYAGVTLGVMYKF